jgi:hypothetical protein
MLWKTVIGHVAVIKLETQSGCLAFLYLAASPQFTHCFQRVINAIGAYAVRSTFPVSMNSSFQSNRALGQTQGGGTQGPATECSALNARAVGCESRGGCPPYAKGSTENDDGDDNNVDDTVGEDGEDFDEEDRDLDPIPQIVGAQRSNSSLELKYFHDVGQWKNQSYRAAACAFCMQEWKRCNSISDFPQQNHIRSKPEKTSTHIRTCLNMPTGKRREYSQDPGAFLQYVAHEKNL